MKLVRIGADTVILSSLEDGLNEARDTMGEDWYSFMKAELDDIDSYCNDLNRQLDGSIDDYDTEVDDHQRHLHDIQELVEQIWEMSSVTRRDWKKMDSVLHEIWQVCHNNT